MSGFNDFVGKVRKMEPLKRHFTAAAFGAGVGIIDASFGFWPGIAGALVSGYTIDKFSHVKDDPNNYEGSKLNSSDYWKNIGSWAAAFFIVSGMLGGSPEQQDDPAVIGPQGHLEQIEETQSAAVTTPATVLSYQPA